ncbi:MAG: sigma-70 family RNA polymerase sigma factor [Lacisediminihabitans sp.]
MGQKTQGSSGDLPDVHPAERTDRELVAEATTGSTTAFDALYRRHLDPVFACAARILRNAEEVEEVVQDTFLTAWEKRASFHFVDESVLPWLLVTCRYKSLNRRRKIDRRDHHHASAPFDDAVDATTDNGAAESAESAELLEAIEAAVSRLSDLDRRVFQLCFIEGMKYTDAATSLGATDGSVRNRLSRLRERLRRELGTLKGSS